jgi:hypothetical protein
MERYLPDSVQYCSLARVHKITKYFNMVEASQKGFVTHVVICNRRSGAARMNTRCVSAVGQTPLAGHGCLLKSG